MSVIPAYEQGASGAGVIVSIIDTGIDVDNPEFAGRIHPQSADLVIAGVVAPGDVRVGGPSLEDEDDHGTPVAGIIGAARDGVGIHGVAPEATLLIFRVDDDADDDLSLYGEAIVEGVERSVDIGAKVVNMSFGSDEPGARADFEDVLEFLKANDIVTVLAAGNDGLANPDGSALGALDVAGAPAAIIAGSVNSLNVISSFSNRAGEGADIYLAAPGQGLRGVVPNGAPGQTRSFSGTSASTPMISGAAALLRSLWPTLTAEEIVDILLTSATDLGAPGTDPIYGRGLLNVGAAVSPLGGVSVSGASGQSVPAGNLGANLSGVYGAGLAGLGDIVVFDSYRRNFTASLDAVVSRALPQALDLERRYSPFDEHRYAAAPLGAGWSMRLRMTSRDEASYSLLNNQMAYSRDADARDDLTDRRLGLAMTGAVGGARLFAAHGFAPASVDRMANAAQNTPFLSDGAFRDAFLPDGTGAFTALTMFRLSPRVSIDMLMTHGEDPAYGDAPPLFDTGAPERHPQVFVARSGVNLALGAARLRFEQGLRRENGAVFNARFGDGADASTVYAALEGVWSPAPLWRLQGRVAAGLTAADSYGFDGLATNAPTLTTTQFSAALRRERLFGPADALWLGVSQPLQIESGALRLMLPTGYNQYTEVLTFTPVTASLAPDGRRLDFEAGYRLFSGEIGAVDVNVIHQTFGGFDAPAATTALVRGNFEF